MRNLRVVDASCFFVDGEGFLAGLVYVVVGRRGGVLGGVGGEWGGGRRGGGK